MVDADGFRPNVGIVIAAGDGSGRVLWARRVGGHDAWQFPQGGMHDGETPEDALYRELYEEVGLQEGDVKLLARSKGWLRYRLPRRLRRNNSTPGFVGQKQKWFLLQLVGDEADIRFDCGDKPEFDDWRWVSYWYPITRVVDFKREVYRRALTDLVHGLPLRDELKAPRVTGRGGHRSGQNRSGQKRSSNRSQQRSSNRSAGSRSGRGQSGQSGDGTQDRAGRGGRKRRRNRRTQRKPSSE